MKRKPRLKKKDYRLKRMMKRKRWLKLPLDKHTSVTFMMFDFSEKRKERLLIGDEQYRKHRYYMGVDPATGDSQSITVFKEKI